MGGSALKEGFSVEEYEVDLRDYLRVIWERKWVVLGVFLAAIAAAAGFSYALPNEYEASALLQWEGRLPYPDLQLPTSKEVIELVKALNQGSDLKLKAETLGDSPRFISLSLRGPLPPQELQEGLSKLIAETQNILSEQIRQDLQREITAIEQRQEFFNLQRAGLLEEIERWILRRQESLRQEREKLLEQLQSLSKPPKGEGQDSLLQGYILQAQATLMDRLMALERELRLLEEELESPSPRPGSGFDSQLAEVERTLEELELSKYEYQRSLELNWAPLHLIQGPEASLKPVGPRRTLM